MPMLRSHLPTGLLWATFCLGWLSPGLAAASSLIEKSPFLPPDFQPPGSAAPQADALPSTTIGHLSFRGVFQIGGQYRFNIHDGQTNQGGWFSQDDPNAPFRILSYDPGDRSIAVEIRGETGRISLQRPTDDPVTVSSGAPPQQQAQPAQPAGQRRVVVPPRRTMRPPPAGARPAPRTPPPPPRPRER